MKLRYILLCCILSLLVLTGYAQPHTDFIQNKGQWDSWIKYKATTMGGEVHLEADGFRYILCDPENVRKIDSFHTGGIQNPLMRFHVYKMSFVGANEAAITGEQQQKNYYNYYLGNKPEKWQTGIHPYRSINYNELYKGINMHVTADESSLIYEFFVAPNADASQVKLSFDGADNMRIKNGKLLINTSVGQIVEMEPVAYQYINDNKVVVACNYHLNNNVVTFDMPDGYDHSKQLIIDPTIAFWCSFTGSTADNWGFTATYDASGDFYLGGLVNALAVVGGGNYPVTPGAYQSTFAGGQGNTALSYGADLGIMKLSPDGVTRIYATYIGGSNNERPHSMIVDATGNLIIAGKTHSTDYPVTTGAYQSTNGGGWDIFVTKLNATGTALVASTYMGGNADDGVNFDSTEVGYGHLKYNYGDDARSEVQVDNAGNIYVAGCTESTNFPTTTGAISTTFGGGLQDGVVFKLNSTLTTLAFSTYLGGSGDDAGYVLAFNNAHTSFYVAGGTNSTNFPVTSGSWQSTYQGDSADGFILKIQNSPPYNVQNGTYVGTANFDQVYGIQVDGTDNVYVMGQSLGGTFPVTAGTYVNANSSQFVMKMNSTLTTDLISTVYGSSDPLHTNISPVAFLVDTCQNVYISGWGGNIMGAAAPGLAHSGTTTGMTVTSDAQQSTTDGYDFYFVVFSPGITALRYATFYGRNAPGPYGEHVDGGTSRFSKQGIIYQAICANCGGTSSGQPPFPTTSGVWAPTDMSSNCNEAALKISFNIGPVDAVVTAGPSLTGCAPLTVNFTNTSTNAVGYIWNFGDGSATSSAFAPSHTFTAGGVYTVTLSASNTSACFRTNDTARLIIVVDTNIIHPAFTYTIVDSCGPYVAIFANSSTDNAGTPTYQWWLGDGTTYTGATPPIHSYPDTGTYTVMMVMTDPAACNSPDTVIQQMRIYSVIVGAHFTIQDSVCEYTTVAAVGGPTNATTYLWTLGNGQTSTSNPLSVTYDSVGTFTITLVSQNPGSCNLADSFTEVIKVLPVPFAAFTFSPLDPEPNVPSTFANQSTNATRYLWEFGDATSSVETNPVHQFSKTGDFRVCLNAYNTSNCPSIVCKTIEADIEPLVGVPSGFSPNGDGQNDVLYVRGSAITKLDLKIFNRWGQMVFETTSQAVGWDGTFNGQPQPIEAYAYVLDVSFIDGTKKLLKGNITLLR